MAMKAASRAVSMIIASFILALLLTAMPLPDWFNGWRPAWVPMVLIYWCMNLPERVGVGVGWLSGMVLDVQTGALLGQNALAFSVLAYLILINYRRVRVFPLPQQAVLVFMYVLLLQFFTLWIRGMMGLSLPGWSFWMSAVTSMLLWPWFFKLLRDMQRKFRVS